MKTDLVLFFHENSFVYVVIENIIKLNYLFRNRALLYLKMFLGMGIFWILEIIGGLSREDVPKDVTVKSQTCTSEPGW